MRVGLSERQWDSVAGGELTGPDGVRYRRRTTRAKRRDADGLIASGVPLVLYYWAGGQLDWFDGDDASAVWRDVRAHLVTADPRPGRQVQWTAGRWENDNGRAVLLLTGYC